MPHQDSNVYRMSRALIGLLILISLLSGCKFWKRSQPKEPSIKIDSPASGMEVKVGEEVAIQSTATGPSTVSWIELWVDGELAATAQAPTPLQPEFSMVQHWQAESPGEHLIEVRAYDEKGADSPPASIMLRVSGEEAQQAITVTPEKAPAIPTATPLPTVPLPTATRTELACERDSIFVEDVTVPDNTEIAPGARFEKVWRVRNNGTCPWDDGYELAFIKGEQMSAPDRTSIPETEPETEADISITFVAPEEPGTYRGDWGMRAPNGELFGAKLYVQIVVVTPTVTPEVTGTAVLTATPTVTVTATPTTTG
ncbi:MAG: NBR1-Ig-like domain-containing protein [Chloroflexota bacterium]|nr:NBR1-Ig-like domain-containing protein [Chloroflexota bacterium]